MLFLDHKSRFFRSRIGRIRAFRLSIHLEAKSARSAGLRCVTRSGTDSSGADVMVAAGMVMVLVLCRVVVAIECSP